MICVCGKEAMDGVKCKYGASHLTYVASVRQFRDRNSHVPYPDDVSPRGTRSVPRYNPKGKRL